MPNPLNHVYNIMIKCTIILYIALNLCIQESIGKHEQRHNGLAYFVLLTFYCVDLIIYYVYLQN